MRLYEGARTPTRRATDRSTWAVHFSHLRSDELHSAYSVWHSNLLPRCFPDYLCSRLHGMSRQCVFRKTRKKGAQYEGYIELLRTAVHGPASASLRSVVYSGWLVGLLRPVIKFGACVHAMDECTIEIG